VLSLLERLLPLARNGLESIGVNDKEIDRYLGIIQQRIERRTSGAMWQLQNYEALRKTHDSSSACRLLLESYYQQSAANIPVAEWDPI